MTPRVRPLSAGTHLPSMNMRWSVAVAVAMRISSADRDRPWAGPGLQTGITHCNRGQSRVPNPTVKNGAGVVDSTSGPRVACRGGSMERVLIKAVYENGVLKPEGPLPVAEGERVSVLVFIGPSRAEQSYGLLKWTGPMED